MWWGGCGGHEVGDKMTSHMTDMCNDNTSTQGVIVLLVVFSTRVESCPAEITD